MSSNQILLAGSAIGLVAAAALGRLSIGGARKELAPDLEFVIARCVIGPVNNVSRAYISRVPGYDESELAPSMEMVPWDWMLSLM